MGVSLVVLAAGMGSRYGGLKQIDEFGPSGESLLEYAVYDALRAGFDHIVLIIRKEFEKAFVEKFADMLQACPSYNIIYQDPDPDFDFVSTTERSKPWGTLHATLCAREVVHQPFAVVNADDRYGTTSYALLYDKLTSIRHDEAFLVGYVLGNTLSEHGTVNRGVCDIHENMLLQDVKERYAIGSDADGVIVDRDGNVFSGEETVSMNFRGFHPDFFKQALPLFELFVRAHKDDPKKEMVIPDGVDILVKQGNLTCRVLKSKDNRQGVTNPEDKERVQDAFDNMIQENVYPLHLR